MGIGAKRLGTKAKGLKMLLERQHEPEAEPRRGQENRIRTGRLLHGRGCDRGGAQEVDTIEPTAMRQGTVDAGERDPRTLAQYRDYRIKSSPDTIVKALEGDYRPEHVFTLTQSLALYDFPQQHIAACDQEIERVLGTFASLVQYQ